MAGKLYPKSALTILIVLTFSIAAHATIIYVDDDALGANKLDWILVKKGGGINIS